LVRTIRSECLYWTLIWSRGHLQRAVTGSLEHYNSGRPHRGIGLAVPAPVGALKPVFTDAHARVERLDVLGGLTHQYRRAA
jgi:hypothetical protein